MTRRTMSSPASVAESLRRIASRIDASKRPNRDAVRLEIKKLIHAMTREDRIRRVSQEMVKIAQDDLAASSPAAASSVDSEVESAMLVTARESVTESVTSMVATVSSMSGK